jgi:hypothetical protein
VAGVVWSGDTTGNVPSLSPGESWQKGCMGPNKGYTRVGKLEERGTKARLLSFFRVHP